MNKLLHLLVFAACIMMTAAQFDDFGFSSSDLDNLNSSLDAYDSYDWDDNYSASVTTGAKAAGAGIVTIILLWILTPVIICVCICVCVCACSKTCCFAPKQQQVVIQGYGQQPQMMAPK